MPKSTGLDALLLRIRGLLDKSSCSLSPPPGDNSFRSARLLSIDDSLTYLQYLTDHLSKEGYLATKAAGGKEGLKLLQSQTFDCVLVDLVMPEVNCIEVCRQITEPRQAQNNLMAVLNAERAGDQGGHDAGV